MRFDQFAPPPPLAALVRCFWAVDSGTTTDGLRSFNTMADGFPGAMVALGNGATLRDREYGTMSPAFLYGQATACRTFTAVGRLCAVGVYFQPHALRSLFGMQADAHTDACFDLAKTFDDDDALSSLLQASDAAMCIGLLSAHFLAMGGKHRSVHDEAMAQAARTIVDANGVVDLPALCAAAKVSDRTFERRFKRSIGIAPRLFARIRRFQHTLHLLREGKYEKLSDIAYAADYADQSHYIRSFKEFTGISPLEFKRKGRELIENLVELPPG